MKKRLSAFLLSLFAVPVQAEQILVTIGDSGQVTEHQLEAALRAAPFATQFPAMDEQDQAYLRGDMLLRLARAEALYQEALAAGIAQSPAFREEIGNFIRATLAQRYLYRLRRQIAIPDAVEHQFGERFGANADALAAARAAYLGQQFGALKQTTLQELREQANIKTYFEHLNSQTTPETVLADGDAVTIRYGDVFANDSPDSNRERMEDRINERIDLSLMALAAQRNGETIDGQIGKYGHDLAIRLLLAEQERRWIPNKQTLIDYFQRHPDIGYIPERRQIGQIVLSSREEAEQIRARIVAGENLFELAGRYSIDPYGRQHRGDMGWLSMGSGAPKIEQAIANLENDQISEPIETGSGWHLVVIVDRKPGERKPFAAIEDRVKQKLVAEKMSLYLREITNKYPLHWQISERIDENR